MLVVSGSVFLLAYLVNTSKYISPNKSQASGTLIGDAPVTRKVFVLVFNPILENQGNQKLTTYNSWSNPNTLTNQLVTRLKTASHNYLTYSITGTQEVDRWYPKQNGYTFTDASYLACLNGTGPCDPQGIDYRQLFTDYGICAKNVDEVWLWGGPWFGYDEFKPVDFCGPTQFVMGFNYERLIDEALHDFGHRMEYIGQTRVGQQPWAQNEDNEFNKFSMINGHCGNIHYPPGTIVGTEEYIYDKSTPVTSDCNGYNNYPTGPFTPQSITCTAWECTQEGFVSWWLSHIPHATGTKYVANQGKAIYNNWWKYYAFFDETAEPLPIPTPVGGLRFTNLTSNLASSNATFSFTYNGLAATNFIVTMSISPDMSTGNYSQFAQGSASPLTNANPEQWDAYTCGTNMYWTVEDGFGTVSPIQHSVVCGTSTPPPTVPPTAPPTVPPTAPVPSKPVLKSPVSATLQTTLRPTLSWNPSAPVVASKYHLEVAKDLVFSNPQSFDNQTALTLELPQNLEPATTYYWRVRGKNALGQYGVWSNTWNFRTSVAAPTANSLVVSNIETLTPRFDWAAVNGATGYTIQAFAVSTYTGTPIYTANTTSNTWTPASDVAAFRGKPNIYWRVRSTKTGTPVYSPSAWTNATAPHSPFVGANPPSVPVLRAVTPVLQQQTRPTLTWNISSGSPTSYQLQVATDTSFVNQPFTQVNNLTTPSYNVAVNLQPLTTYYWRVRSVSALGTSRWSAIGTFKIAVPTPTLTSPANEATDVKTLRPTFTWNPVPGASATGGYTIQFSKTNTNGVFGPILAVPGTYNGTSFTPTADIAARGLPLYWRVRVAGTSPAGYGPSLWSETRKLTLPNPPSVPVLLLPASGALSATYTPTFTWRAATNSPTRYWIQVGTNNTFTTKLVDKTDVAGISYTSPTLPSGTILYWRVKSINANSEESNWSAARVLKMKTQAPTLSLPSNGQLVSTLRPTFNWSSSNGATSYRIQYSYSATMASVFLTRTSTTNTYTSTTNFARSRNIYWRVIATSPTGASVPSTIFKFTTPAN